MNKRKIGMNILCKYLIILSTEFVHLTPNHSFSIEIKSGLLAGLALVLMIALEKTICFYCHDCKTVLFSEVAFAAEISWRFWQILFDCRLPFAHSN
jgi:hypothetical protein